VDENAAALLARPGELGAGGADFGSEQVFDGFEISGVGHLQAPFGDIKSILSYYRRLSSKTATLFCVFAQAVVDSLDQCRLFSPFMSNDMLNEGKAGDGASITARHWVGLAMAPPVYAWFQWGWAPAGATAEMRSVAALTGVMAVLWIFESVPLAATALLPLVLLPLWGVAMPAQAASSYANDLIFLFIGGFILANGIEHWGQHRRLARCILALVGTRKRRLVAAIRGVTAFISLWISNTAARC
jgi:di/tricarboxylate transporter